MTHCAYSQIEYTLKVHVSGTKSGGFGLIRTGVLTYLHGRVVGDMPGRKSAGLTAKVAKILKDHFMFQKFSKNQKEPIDTKSDL